LPVGSMKSTLVRSIEAAYIWLATERFQISS
jgi:hypothetical protein